MEYYRIGLIVRPHGIHGAVKLQPLTDNTARYKGLRHAYLEQNGRMQKVDVDDIGIRPDFVTLHIAGVDTPEAAELLRGAYLSVDKANAVPLPPDTYFIADLIGCKVWDTDGFFYGELKDVLQTGANDVYVVEGPKGMLLPALKKALHEVCVEEKRIVLIKDVLEEVALFAD